MSFRNILDSQERNWRADEERERPPRAAGGRHRRRGTSRRIPLLGVGDGRGRGLAARPPAGRRHRHRIRSDDAEAVRKRIVGCRPNAIVSMPRPTPTSTARSAIRIWRWPSTAPARHTSRRRRKRSAPGCSASAPISSFPATAARPIVKTRRRMPVNAYGRSKLAGEQSDPRRRSVVRRRPHGLGLRRSWPAFSAHLAPGCCATAPPSRWSTTGASSPTYASDLAEALTALDDRARPGIFHLRERRPRVALRPGAGSGAGGESGPRRRPGDDDGRFSAKDAAAGAPAAEQRVAQRTGGGARHPSPTMARSGGRLRAEAGGRDADRAGRGRLGRGVRFDALAHHRSRRFHRLGVRAPRAGGTIRMTGSSRSTC